jgi:hypothetical protein
METQAETTPLESRGQASLMDAFFDLSFSKAITPTIIKWLYLFGALACALAVGSGVFTAFSIGFTAGLFAMLVAPVLFLFYILVMRVFLELMQAIFRIADSLKRIEQQSGK